MNDVIVNSVVRVLRDNLGSYFSHRIWAENEAHNIADEARPFLVVSVIGHRTDNETFDGDMEAEVEDRFIVRVTLYSDDKSHQHKYPPMVQRYLSKVGLNTVTVTPSTTTLAPKVNSGIVWMNGKAISARGRNLDALVPPTQEGYFKYYTVQCTAVGKVTLVEGNASKEPLRPPPLFPQRAIAYIKTYYGQTALAYSDIEDGVYSPHGVPLRDRDNNESILGCGWTSEFSVMRAPNADGRSKLLASTDFILSVVRRSWSELPDFFENLELDGKLVVTGP